MTQQHCPIFTVDAFTNKAFAGNPAAVCVLGETLQEDLMKNIAKEMNLSGINVTCNLQ